MAALGRVGVPVPKKDCWSMTFEVLTGNDPLVKPVGHFFTSIKKQHKECGKKFQTSMVAHIHYHSQWYSESLGTMPRSNSTLESGYTEGPGHHGRAAGVRPPGPGRRATMPPDFGTQRPRKKKIPRSDMIFTGHLG